MNKNASFSCILESMIGTKIFNKEMQWEEPEILSTNDLIFQNLTIMVEIVFHVSITFLPG